MTRSRSFRHPFAFAAALWLAASTLAAQPPAGYYDTVDSSNASTLRSTLHEVVDDHTRYPYTAATTDTWDILNLADEDPNNTANIIDVYKNASYAKIPGGTGAYNREHTWPKSYGFPNDASDNYPFTDCHMLFLSDSGYNSSRSNKPYRTCHAGCSENPTDFNDGRGGGSGVYPGNSNWTEGSFTQGTWETWDGRKGDVARAIFYMDVRYEGGTHGGTGAAEPDLIVTDVESLIDASNTGVNESVAYMGMLTVLLQWHQQDPVDSREVWRNEVVYSFQGNRNPFIDHPEWIDCLFNDVCSTDTTPPAAPTGLMATAGNGSVDLSWIANGEPDLAGYNVYRATVSGGPYSKINGALVGTNAYTDATVTNGTTYYYVVTAVDTSSNESGDSNEASATPDGGLPDTTPPAAPTGLGASPGDGQVQLNWNPNGEPDLDGYNVYRATASGGPYSLVNGSLVATASYTDTAVTNGTTYFYVVTALDTSANESPDSNEASATPQAPGGGGVILSEVFYDISSTDDGWEWVELYNSGEAPVNLSGFCLGNGGVDYTYSTAQLSGTVASGATFVVGGPSSSAANGDPVYDQVLNFSPDFQNSGATADGVALFDVPCVQVTASTVPVDAVVYGGANDNNLIDETGSANPPEVGSAPPDSSIERIDLAGSWQVQASPNPNAPAPGLGGGGGEIVNLATADWSTSRGSIAGSYQDTHAQDDVYEELIEGLSGGKPANRYSTIEHVWTFDVAAGVAYTFHVDAHHSVNSEGDDFHLYYSLDNVNYSFMLTVTKTADDDVLQSFVFPEDVSGTLYVLAIDADATAGNQALDSLFVDEMHVVTDTGGGPDTTPPAAPSGLTATAGDGSVSLDWADNSEPDLAGYNVHRSTAAGGPYTQINGATVTASDYVDNGVVNGTTYYYVVTAVDDAGNESGLSNEASATPQSGGATTIHVASIVPSTVGGGKKKGRAVVTIVDNTGAPVSGAQVTGTFSGDFNETVAAATDAAGEATLDTAARQKEPITFTFCVDSVTHGSLTYDPASNVETCDGI